MSKEYLGPPLFKYTAEQWARIAAELPERGCLEEIRASFEARIFGLQLAEFKDKNDPFPKIEDHENLAKKARAFITAYRPLLVVVPDSQRAERRRKQLIEEISKLAELQEAEVRAWRERIREGERRGRKAPYYRDQLLYHFVSVWAHLGGQVGSSVSAYKSKTGGPLVRFLMSAANPVLPQPLTAGAARAFIRKIQAGKSEDPWSQWDFSAATNFDDGDANMA